MRPFTPVPTSFDKRGWTVNENIARRRDEGVYISGPKISVMEGECSLR